MSLGSESIYLPSELYLKWKDMLQKKRVGALEILHLVLTLCGVPIYCNKIFNIPVAPYTHSAISGLDGVGWMVSGWDEV